MIVFNSITEPSNSYIPIFSCSSNNSSPTAEACTSFFLGLNWEQAPSSLYLNYLYQRVFPTSGGFVKLVVRMCDLSKEFQLSNEFITVCSFSLPKTASPFPVYMNYFFKSSHCIFKDRYFPRKVLFFFLTGGRPDFSK